jgi:signal transduction histidine kinase
VALYRIIQEALTNIRKHAWAKQVKVTLKEAPGCLQFLIEDDGVGFDGDSVPSPRQTFGLDIMAERAAEINGRVDIHSTPGQGTKVRVEVPLGESRTGIL